MLDMLARGIDKKDKPQKKVRETRLSKESRKMYTGHILSDSATDSLNRQLDKMKATLKKVSK